MKKLLFIIISLLFAAPLTAASASDGETALTVSAVNANAPVGGFVDVRINLDRNLHGVSTLGLVISYDPNFLERVSVQSPGTVLPRTTGLQPPAGHNPFRLNYQWGNPIGYTTATGELSTVRFRVLQSGVSAINITVRESTRFVSVNPWIMERLPASAGRGLVQSGWVAPLVGDVHTNGRLDSADVAVMRGYITGRRDTITYLLADMNEDGVVDILDLTMLRLRLAGAA